jgi:hypothetical protein
MVVWVVQTFHGAKNLKRVLKFPNVSIKNILFGLLKLLPPDPMTDKY